MIFSESAVAALSIVVFFATAWYFAKVLVEAAVAPAMAAAKLANTAAVAAAEKVDALEEEKAVAVVAMAALEKERATEDRLADTLATSVASAVADAESRLEGRYDPRPIQLLHGRLHSRYRNDRTYHKCGVNLFYDKTKRWR